MNWKRFKSNLLVKYTLSYVLIFLIPVIVITIIVYVSSANSLRAEIQQSNLNQLYEVKTLIDNHVTELQRTAALMSYDETLTSYMVHHPYFSNDAIKTLNRYKSSNATLSEIFLYFHGDSNIYSSKGMSDINLTFTDIYSFSDWTSDDIFQEMNEIKSPIMRPIAHVQQNYREQSMLAYLVPIIPNSLYPHATVMFLMNESDLTGIMNSILNDFAGNSYILDQNGSILTQNQHDSILKPDDVQLLSTLETGIHDVQLNNRSYSVVSVQSDQYDWKYITAMPSNQFFSRMIHVQTLIILVFIAVVITFIPIAMKLAKRQYHPIEDLMKFAKLNIRDNQIEKMSSSNEWDWIRQTLHHYNDRINLQEPYVRNHCLLLLMKHGKPNDEETKQLIRTLGLEIDNGTYFVVMIALDQSTEADTATQESQHVFQQLHELDLPDQRAQVIGIKLSQQDQIALMVSLHDDAELDLYERTEQIVNHIHDIILEHSHFIPSISVGTSYRKLEELNESYIEAVTALETRILSNEANIIYFDQLNLRNIETFWIPKNQLLKLVQSLKQGNEAVSTHMLDMIFHSIQSHSLSVSQMRCICYDLLNTMLKVAAELQMSHIIESIPNIASFDTLAELKCNLNELAHQICEQSIHKLECEQHSLIDDVISYMNEQYADYTLSLEHISLKFSVSTSYLSRALKDRTGLSFTQYMWKLRMDEVMKQLVTTNDPLKEIIARVGYLDAPNFIRKFKKETGYTPGQYRKLHKQ